MRRIAVVLLFLAVSARADYREFLDFAPDPSIETKLRMAAEATLKQYPKLKAEDLAISVIDVSNPAAPDEVTAGPSMSVSAVYNGVTQVKQVNYWTWYYRASATGFNLVAPRTGKFVGEHFYRAGRSIMDIHKLAGNAPPSADFTWSPLEIYPGTPVTFTDRSTGAPTQWSWSFQDGTPGTSFLQSQQVTFGTAGAKTVDQGVHPQQWTYRVQSTFHRQSSPMSAGSPEAYGRDGPPNPISTDGRIIRHSRLDIWQLSCR